MLTLLQAKALGAEAEQISAAVVGGDDILSEWSMPSSGHCSQWRLWGFCTITSTSFRLTCIDLLYITWPLGQLPVESSKCMCSLHVCCNCPPVNVCVSACLLPLSNWSWAQHAQTRFLLLAHLLGTLCDMWRWIFWVMIAGNVTVVADKMVNTAMLARAVGLPYTSYYKHESNGTNDQMFAQMIVTGLNQAAISREIQGQAFASSS